MKNLIFIISIFFVLNQYRCVSEDDFDIDFEKLHAVNQIWLGDVFNPESAVLLKHPPYSFLRNKYARNVGGNISHLIDEQNNPVPTPGYSKCSADIVELLFSNGSNYLYQMLDAAGKIDSGISRGNIIWPGNYDECLNIYVPMDDKGHGDFHGQYCTAIWTLHSGKNFSVGLTTGLCFPDSCSGESMKSLLKNVMHFISEYLIPKKYQSLLTLKDIQCKSPQNMNRDYPSVAILTFISCILLLVLIGSSITIWDYGKKNVNSYAFPYGAIGEPESSSIQADETKITPTRTDLDVLPITGIQPRITTGALFKEVLLCFSSFVNGGKILNTKQVTDQLLSIHGIRVLSMTWVILGHTYNFCILMISNKLDGVDTVVNNFSFQLLLQASFSVDSFFVLSGFLLTYLFLREMTKREGKMQWLYFYIHRFWRLTPAFMMMVFFYLFVYKYLSSGPFWNDHLCDSVRGTWWWYLLYINNFLNVNDLCVSWTWYLANDMQFYIISPLFLYPLWRWPKIGFGILFSLLLSSWIITAVLSYEYDIMPTFVGLTDKEDFIEYANKIEGSFSLIYDKPYTRIPPYLIGAILGYILFKTNGRKSFLPLWQQILGWTCGAFFSLSVIFGLHHVEMSKTTAMFYNAFSRSSFSLGLAWVIFACETGHGGVVNKILSMKFWMPLSRLTYCAYLVHPIMIRVYFQSLRTTLYFSHFVIVTAFFGLLTMTYALAFCFSLTFESPFMNIEKFLLKRR